MSVPTPWLLGLFLLGILRSFLPKIQTSVTEGVFWWEASGELVDDGTDRPEASGAVTAQGGPVTTVAKTQFLNDSLRTSTSPAAVELYQRLSSNMVSSAPKTLFGHQDDFAYGYAWPYKRGEPLPKYGDAWKSDVFFATNQKEYPAVFGFDISNLDSKSGLNIDGIDKDDMRKWIHGLFHGPSKLSLGGGKPIVTLSMHQANPLTGGTAFDNTPGTVKAILPGGEKHDHYVNGVLAALAAFFRDLSSAGIAVVFRPYHEHNQKWSWWQTTACTAEEFVQLWRMTVDYLRGPGGVDNVLYAISPQDVGGDSPDGALAEYFDERYPGDAYVDLWGFDAYRLYDGTEAHRLGRKLRMLVDHSLAEGRRKGLTHPKPVLLTEVGGLARSGQGKPDYVPHSWWTRHLGHALEMAQSRVAYALVWRNEYQSLDCFVPVPLGGFRSICQLEDFQEWVSRTTVGLLAFTGIPPDDTAASVQIV